MTAWNLNEERIQLKHFEMLATGHSRSGNQRLANVFEDLVRATQRKIAALEELEKLQGRSKSTTAQQ
jgi:hypothetical protein